MCNDDAVGSTGAISRRKFIQNASAFAALGILADKLPLRPSLMSPERPMAMDGSSALSTAMHIHSSFSEQSGSMDSHLYQAALNAVDVLWWTDHDTMLDGLHYRDVVHFTSFSESGAAGQGGKWDWAVSKGGPNTSASTGGIVQYPCSPNDPVDGGSLHLSAKSSSTEEARYGYYADCHPAGWNYRGNLAGQSLLVDVLLRSGWSRGYLELLVETSYHEAAGGMPAGYYTVSYRFVPHGVRSLVTNGRYGIVTIPVTSPWQTVEVSPTDDIAELWPALDPRDFALWQIYFNAVSTGDLVDGYFDYVRFNRSMSGQAHFQQQAEMAAGLSGKYPSVTQHQGLEISLSLPHVNWFGKNIELPSYGNTTYAGYKSFLRETAIPAIHQAGGLASYNHPFGYGADPARSVSQQNTLLAQTASELLSSRALGSDILEVGYNLRQGVDIKHHLGLWDVLSRNALFMTGNGVSDDHVGTDWHHFLNNWVTYVWAPSSSMPDLLGALAAGRAWCASLSAYRGALDLWVDGAVPMGSVDVSSVNSRRLVATASELPAGCSLQLLRGTVDYAGTHGLSPTTSVIAEYAVAQVGSGVVQQIDTSSSCFVRSQVLSPSGAAIATSNPVWLLRQLPPAGVPAARQV